MYKRFRKTHQDTIDLTEKVRQYLFSVGVRTSKERAWDIFYNIFRIPFEVLNERTDTVVYRGQGNRLNKEQKDQILSVEGIGKFELVGVVNKACKDKTLLPKLKFNPSKEIQNLVEGKEIVYEQ